MNANQQGVNFTSWQLIKDIFQLAKPYKLRFTVASLIRIAGDLAQLYPAFAFASTVVFLTQYSAGESLAPLWLIIALWFGATILRALSQFFSKYHGYWIAERIALDVTLKAVQHMFLLDMAWHERENSGNKIKRVQNAADAYNKIIRLWFNSIIEVVVNLVAISIIISRFDHVVLVVLLVFLVSYFIISAIMTRKAGSASYAVNAREEDVNGLFFEAINNIRTVKVMAMAKTLYATITKGTEALFGRLLVRIFWYQSRNSFLSFWAVAFKIGIIIIIVRGIIAGHYEIGFLILFNSYFSDLRESIDELSVASVDFVTSRFSIARMRTILDQPVTIDDESKKIVLPKTWEKIVLKKVSFAYGENEVLNDVSFEVQRGEKVGIVGLSGAGKSTLFKLLLKEREDYSGDVLFDGLSIKRISKTDYFKHVSVVLQDTEVFNVSLKENITITNTKEKANQKLLQQALTTAHITEVVDKLPNGLDTIIGEKGVKLSGGERQRLGIARAVFKEPQILLLDEATSHLDLESEQKIRDSLHKFFENVTAIVIAHRLTTIKEMDKILVIEDGKIIESGTFEELQVRGGRFHELWEKQKL